MPSTRERARAFARDFPHQVRRAGLLGTAELVLARAAPRLCSFERAFVLVADTRSGVPHEELSPRRVRALDDDVLDVFRELARNPEPDSPHLTRAELEDRFDRGEELWLFHAEGRVAHLLWVNASSFWIGRQRVRLAPDERYVRSVVTLRPYQGRGFARKAHAHLKAALREEGVATVFLLVHGFNRRFRASLLRSGSESLACLSVVRLLGHEWTRLRQTSSPLGGRPLVLDRPT